MKTTQDSIPAIMDACGSKASHSFHYAGWDVTVGLDATHPDGIISGHADLFDNAVFQCRLALSGRHDDGSSAMHALACKARLLIDSRRRGEA
ncbi:hypothetical protein J7E62_08325 [Variovorax paradoxus]|nr:hypothetical protein [Variovorax paradoxus]